MHLGRYLQERHDVLYFPAQAGKTRDSPNRHRRAAPWTSCKACHVRYARCAMRVPRPRTATPPFVLENCAWPPCVPGSSHWSSRTRCSSLCLALEISERTVTDRVTPQQKGQCRLPVGLWAGRFGSTSRQERGNRGILLARTKSFLPNRNPTWPPTRRNRTLRVKSPRAISMRGR